MAKRTALDVRLDIVDAYDSGLLTGNATVAEIAKVVASTPRSVGKALTACQYRTVRDMRNISERIPARWTPPRRLPTLTNRHSALSRAIVAVFDEGRWSGRCYARDLIPLVGSDEKAISHTLKRLGFKIVKRAHSKFVRIEPAVYSPPGTWPPKIRKEAELRGLGLSTGQVAKTMELAAEISAVIDSAIRKLDVQDIPLNKRGQMKAKIHEVIRDNFNDSIPRQEVASWLGESSEAPMSSLKGITVNLRTFASNRGHDCSECGRRCMTPAARR